MQMSLYQNFPLTGSKTHIRLLRFTSKASPHSISFEVTVRKLEEAPSFKALSYEWGDDKLVNDIVVGGHRIAIRQNLWSFLRQLVKQQDGGHLWCDAICIDQSSDTERSHQVQLMHHIYHAAVSTLVWLGDAYDDSDHALQALNHFGSLKHVDLVSDVCYDKMRVYEALVSLTERTYWSRVWIIQEIVVARRVLVYCGSQSVSWHTLVQACTFPADTVTAWHADIWKPNIKSRQHAQARRRILGRSLHRSMFTSIARSRRTWPILSDSLQILVERFETSQCQDDRDNVIALLGIAKETQTQTEFDVDYSLDKTETFFRLLAWAQQGAVTVRYRMRFACVIARAMKLSLTPGTQTTQPSSGTTMDYKSNKGKHKVRSVTFDSASSLSIRLKLWSYEERSSIFVHPDELPAALSIPLEASSFISGETQFFGSLDTGILLICQKMNRTQWAVNSVGTYQIDEKSYITDVRLFTAAEVGCTNIVVMRDADELYSVELKTRDQIQLFLKEAFPTSFDIVVAKDRSQERVGGVGSLPHKPEDNETVMERLLREQISLSNRTTVIDEIWSDDPYLECKDDMVRQDFEDLLADAAPLARYRGFRAPRPPPIAPP